MSPLLHDACRRRSGGWIGLCKEIHEMSGFDGDHGGIGRGLKLVGEVRGMAEWEFLLRFLLHFLNLTFPILHTKP